MSDPSAQTVVTSGDGVRTLVRLARMLEHACTDLTLPQYRLLVMVAGGDDRATQLAGRLALSKPTVTAVVDGLVERGLLARSAVTGDKRAIQLTVTEAGQGALMVAEGEMGQRLTRVLDRCADPDVARAGLGQLAGAIEQVVAERLAEGSR